MLPRPMRVYIMICNDMLCTAYALVPAQSSNLKYFSQRTRKIRDATAYMTTARRFTRGPVVVIIVALLSLRSRRFSADSVFCSARDERPYSGRRRHTLGLFLSRRRARAGIAAARRGVQIGRWTARRRVEYITPAAITGRMFRSPGGTISAQITVAAFRLHAQRGARYIIRPGRIYMP